MHILGSLKSKISEKLKMLRKAGKPFVSTNYMCCAHKMIIYCMSEMICGNSVRLKKHKIFIILRHFKFSFYKVSAENFLFSITIRKNTKYKRVTFFKIILYFLYSDISLLHHCSASSLCFCFPVFSLVLSFFINTIKCFELFFSCKTRVCSTFTNKLFSKNMIKQSGSYSTSV